MGNSARGHPGGDEGARADSHGSFIVGGRDKTGYFAAASVQNVCMPPTTAPAEVQQPDIGQESDTSESTDRPWIVLVWNDPINTMEYVTLVFQKVFGYSKEKATQLMLDVHHKGRAGVSSGTRESAERDVFRLHEHGLWATMQQDD